MFVDRKVRQCLASWPLWLCVVLTTASPAWAEEWGTLKGKFVYGGDAPTPSPLQVTKDVEVCGVHKLVDESLVVNPENKGIADVIIFMSLDRGQKAPKVHPSYASQASAEVHMDNHDCRFEPHVVLVRTGQTLIVGNKDTVGHNTKVDSLRNPAINPIVPAGGEFKQKYSKEERLPSRVSCSIHPWMNGWVVVKELPYNAVTDADGNFTIENLPVGKWSFQVWHGYGGGSYISEVSKGGKSEKWKKGKFDVEIKPGDNDLGTITIPKSVFK